MNTTDPRVEMFIDLWKKHYSQNLEKCPDCEGFTVHVCEKALREMLTAQVKRMDKVSVSLKENIKAILVKYFDEEMESNRKSRLVYEQLGNDKERILSDINQIP